MGAGVVFDVDVGDLIAGGGAEEQGGEVDGDAGMAAYGGNGLGAKTPVAGEGEVFWFLQDVGNEGLMEAASKIAPGGLGFEGWAADDNFVALGEFGEEFGDFLGWGLKVVVEGDDDGVTGLTDAVEDGAVLAAVGRERDDGEVRVGKAE